MGRGFIWRFGFESVPRSVMRSKAAILICGLACLQIFPAQDAGRSSGEQTHFSAEDDAVRRPMVLPDGALRVIKEDPYVAGMLQDQAPAATQIPKGWLMASQVHLAGPGENDIVVVASGLLMGANITSFWVLRPSRVGYELLLTAQGHDLLIRHSRSKGYRDIELLSSTAVTVSTVSFKFDGRKYTGHSGGSKPIL